ncbi:uncharacterized protein MONBRDRAFT_24641 [Monosiga brevicollis MX1]|uniref:Uncharacterized protein n=1 Tax=Monosiga brevicollis TaxID=81824 RepID=A9UX17_MONBE|nr:uncharacterized protein MONBRDRAFT_24641 [Monosiga brevicollis MX1]EDQ90314.1 predicted protein [Monosiga brevicollis MX1]|eukprot:XP_001745081.1 hypothetical protein [Monosiga brevicollis MX1]
MNAAMDDLKNLDNSMAPFLCANEKQDPYVFVADKLAGAPEMQAVIQAVNLFHYDLRQSVIVLTHPGFTRKVIRLTDLQKSTCFRRAVFPAYGYQSPFLQTLSGCSGEAKDLCEGYRNKIPERAHAPACPA